MAKAGLFHTIAILGFVALAFPIALIGTAEGWSPGVTSGLLIAVMGASGVVSSYDSARLWGQLLPLPWEQWRIVQRRVGQVLSVGGFSVSAGSILYSFV
ncbi:MAG: hypothetical protein RKE49_03675 [Oceanicaulis sp.]